MFRRITSSLLLATFSLSALASDYYVVVPMPGKPNRIAVTLSPYTLPTAKPNRAYRFDMNAVVQVSGDRRYDPSQLAWSTASGALPAGVAFGADGVLSGIPVSANGAGSEFEVRAEYKGTTDQERYRLVVEAPSSSVELSGSATSNTSPAVSYGDTSVAGAGAYKWVYVRNMASSGNIDASITLDSPSGKHSIAKVYKMGPGGALHAETCTAGGNARSGCVADSAVGGTGNLHLAVMLKFSPTALGTDAATLTVADKSSAEPLVTSVTGTGAVIPATIEASNIAGSTTAPQVDFGDADSGTGVTRTFYLRNVGDKGQIRGDLTLASASGAFNIVSVYRVANWGGGGPQTCTSGGNTRVDCSADDRSLEYYHLAVVVQAKSATLGLHEATLTFAQSGGASPTVLNLKANSVLYAPTTQVSGAANTYTAPPLAFGDTSSTGFVTKFIYLRNVDTKGQITGDLTLDSPSGAFTIVQVGKFGAGGGSFGTTCGTGGNVRTNCAVDDRSGTAYHMGIYVQFKPNAVGGHAAQLRFAQKGAASPLVLDLSGNSVVISPTVTASGTYNANTTPTSDYGARAVGQTNVQYVVLRNLGTQGRVETDVTVTSPTGAFTVLGAYRTAAWGGSGGFNCASITSSKLTSCKADDRSAEYYHLTVMVQFKPLAVGAHTAELSINHNGTGTNPVVLNVSGTGQ